MNNPTIDLVSRIQIALSGAADDVTNAPVDKKFFVVFSSNGKCNPLCVIRADKDDQTLILEKRAADGITNQQLPDTLLLAAMPLIMGGQIDRIVTGNYRISSQIFTD